MTMTKTIVNKICHRNSIQYFTCLLSLSIYGSLFVSLLQAFIFVWKAAKICQIFWSSQCFAEMTLIPKKVFFVIFYKYSWFPNSFLLLHFLQFVHICPSDVVSCVGKHLMGLQKNWTIYWWSQTDPKRRFDIPSATDRVNRGKTKRSKIQLRNWFHIIHADCCSSTPTLCQDIYSSLWSVLDWCPYIAGGVCEPKQTQPGDWQYWVLSWNRADKDRPFKLQMTLVIPTWYHQEYLPTDRHF